MSRLSVYSEGLFHINRPETRKMCSRQKAKKRGGCFVQETREQAEEENRMEQEMKNLRQIAASNRQEIDCFFLRQNLEKKEWNTPEWTDSGGSFYFRTALCLLIFCGFLWLQKEERSILGIAPTAIQEAVSQSVVLPEWKDSGKIDFIIP